jgi:hypothetical protein
MSQELPEFSPLPDVAMSWISDDQPGGINPQVEFFIRSIICRFCDSLMSFEECKSALTPFLTTTHAIDRLYMILHCQSDPFPSYPEVRSRCDDGKKRAKSWGIIEDNRLLYAIHRFGLHSWPAVAAFVGNNRSRAQCAQRWYRGLDPRISKEEWTHMDDLRLVHLVTIRGDAGWTWISRELGNRSDVQCRYRYLHLKNSGREAQLLAQLAPITPSVRPQLTGEALHRQLLQLMSKKKGRPMKTQFPTPFGQNQVEGRKTKVQQRTHVEDQTVRVTGGTANPEPIELFIDWNRDRHDEVMELMSW